MKLPQGMSLMMKIPDMVRKVDEVLRLMRRKPAEKEHHEGCFVCGRDHLAEDCFEKIPPGVELDRDYDQVCIGCGRIGEICCSKGAYATLRRCGACGWRGHWYWDDKCDKDFVHHPNRVKLSFLKDLLSAEQSLQNKEEDEAKCGNECKTFKSESGDMDIVHATKELTT